MNPILPKPDLRTRWDRLSRPKKLATGTAAVLFVPSFVVGAGQGLGQAVTGYTPAPSVTVTVTATARSVATVTARPQAATTVPAPSTTKASPTPPSPSPTPTPTPGPTAQESSAASSDSGSSSTTDTNPVLLSPSGHYYHAGEFCPHKDDGITTVDSAGTPITCSDVNGYYRWHY